MQAFPSSSSKIAREALHNSFKRVASRARIRHLPNEACMTKTTLGFVLLIFAVAQLCIFVLIKIRQRRPQTEVVVNELKKLDRVSRAMQILAFSVVLIMILKGVI
jgi:hypothetical protein